MTKSNRLPNPPSQALRLYRLTKLGAPAFTALPCPACAAQPPEPCHKPRGGLPAHFERAQAALALAYRPEETQ